MQRINAAAREPGMIYSTLICALNRARLDMNRKLLADIAAREPKAFDEIAKIAQKHLPGHVVKCATAA